MTLKGVTDEQRGRLYKRFNAVIDRTGEGKSLDFDEVMTTLQNIHDNQAKNQFLRRLYTNEEILVGATTGREIITEAGHIFTGYLDSDFKNWGTDRPSGISTVMSAKVYEMHQDATFQQMFGSLGNIDDLCWEQGQIINFCRENKDKLRQGGYGNFFLFKVKGNDQPFVANVRLGGDGLRVYVLRFGDGSVWGAGGRRRVVVP